MGLLTALGLFTIAPVRARPELTAADARRAMVWFPVVGAGLGTLAGLPLVAVDAAAPHAVTLGAVLAVGLLAVLTRGLHLDGLADTADGLGSRAPAERALSIMRQSDIGPFGVVTLVVVLLLDVTALASLPHGAWGGCAALAVAALTGRLAALHATAAAPARPDGFGALVHGAADRTAAAVLTVVALAAGGVLAASVGALWWWWPLTQVVALLVAAGVRRHTGRRFGGTTGDVYGALIEIATTVTLVGACLR